MRIVGITVQQGTDDPVAPQCQIHLPVVFHKKPPFVKSLALHTQPIDNNKFTYSVVGF
jgi:hypothetical protein